MASKDLGMKVVGAGLSKAEVERRRKRLAGKRYVGRPWRKRDYEAVEAVRKGAEDLVRVSVGLAMAVSQARARGVDEDDVFVAVGKAVLASLEDRRKGGVVLPKPNREPRFAPVPERKAKPSKCLGRSRKACPKCGMPGLNRWPGPEKGTHLLCSRCGWTDLRKVPGSEVVFPYERIRTKAEVPGR